MRAGLPRDNFRVIQMSTIFTLGGRMVRQWIANPLFTGSIPVLKSIVREIQVRLLLLGKRKTVLERVW